MVPPVTGVCRIFKTETKAQIQDSRETRMYFWGFQNHSQHRQGLVRYRDGPPLRNRFPGKRCLVTINNV